MAVAYDFETISDADEAAILDQIDRWLKRDVAPQAMELEHADEYPHARVQQMKNGFLKWENKREF